MLVLAEHPLAAPLNIPPTPISRRTFASALVVGRLRRIGERIGLIGALTIETATRYLNARDVDGVVIGEGLGPRVAGALLTMLAQSARFRDLLGTPAGEDEPCVGQIGRAHV